MSSPSTNPSSCDSVPNFPPMASTSGSFAEGCSATTAYGSMKTSSPAMANAAPGQEPHYPVGSVPKKIFLTSEMANEAAEDFKREKFDSIHEWYERYQKRLAEKKEEEQGKGQQKAVKRKLEEEEGDSGAKRVALATVKEEQEEPKEEEKPVYETLGEEPAKPEENPLKKMEMMAHFSVIQPSSRITEVAVEGKKEKAEKSDNATVRDENSIPQQMMPPMPFPHPSSTFSPQQMGQMASPLPSPYGPPGMPPPHMMMGMSPFPPGARPPFPTGKPGAAPAMSPYAGMLPGMPPFPGMGHPGMRVPPGMTMSQYQQWYHHMMTARGGMPSPAAGMSPFPGMPPRMMPPYPPMMPPGPLSGPNPMMNKAMPPGGPMTAPMAVPSPYGPMCSPYPGIPPPAQGSPMVGGPDPSMAPNPIFSFSDASAAPGHPSMLPDKTHF